jgi:predicted RNA-binding Zn-ribbon protein involved in translation (DUF1610 family)
MKPRKPCGTQTAGYRHYRHGEPVDEACRVAINFAQNERHRCPDCGYRRVKCRCKRPRR